MGFSGRFINEGSRFCDPVVLEVAPVPTHRITAHSANMIVSAQRGPGETFQNDAESSGCAVEMAGLKPDTIGIRHPATVVCYVDGGNEVLPTSVTWIKAIGKTAESSDRHNCLPVSRSLTQYPPFFRGPYLATNPSASRTGFFQVRPNE